MEIPFASDFEFSIILWARYIFGIHFKNLFFKLFQIIESTMINVDIYLPLQSLRLILVTTGTMFYFQTQDEEEQPANAQEIPVFVTDILKQVLTNGTKSWVMTTKVHEKWQK